MNIVVERTIGCPNCGEDIEVLIDQSISQQDYIEDCQVCCRPIRIMVDIATDGSIELSAVSENE